MPKTYFDYLQFIKNGQKYYCHDDNAATSDDLSNAVTNLTDLINESGSLKRKSHLESANVTLSNDLTTSNGIAVLPLQGQGVLSYAFDQKMKLVIPLSMALTSSDNATCQLIGITLASAPSTNVSSNEETYYELPQAFLCYDSSGEHTFKAGTVLTFETLFIGLY